MATLICPRYGGRGYVAILLFAHYVEGNGHVPKLYFSLLWGPREGRVHVVILISPYMWTLRRHGLCS